MSRRGDILVAGFFSTLGGGTGERTGETVGTLGSGARAGVEGNLTINRGGMGTWRATGSQRGETVAGELGGGSGEMALPSISATCLKALRMGGPKDNGL